MARYARTSSRNPEAEKRRRSATAAPADERGRPVGDHRVAVEHRHADVVDVVRRAPRSGRASAPPGRREPALGADRGLGRAGGAGGEVEEEAVRRGLAGRAASPGSASAYGASRSAYSSVSVTRTRTPGRSRPSSSGQVGALGDQQPALGVQDVAGQLGAPAGGVDPGDGGPREGRRAQPEGELGGVVEQDAEVRLGARWQEVDEQRGAGGGARGDLVVGERRGPRTSARAGGRPTGRRRALRPCASVDSMARAR